MSFSSLLHHQLQALPLWLHWLLVLQVRFEAVPVTTQF